MSDFAICKRSSASMRPGDFSPGNLSGVGAGAGVRVEASMRPGDFSPGNEPPAAGTDRGRLASMRPGDFSPGNMQAIADSVRVARALQ